MHKEDEIVQVISEYFRNLFSSVPGEREEAVNRALHLIISEEENLQLISISSDREIKEAAFSINADKALGPDGFRQAFSISTGKVSGQILSKRFRASLAGIRYRKMSMTLISSSFRRSLSCRKFQIIDLLHCVMSITRSTPS